MKTCSDKSELPSGPHYVIIEFSTFWVEGDERSRTNPGHGYPGHHESMAKYICFNDKAEWEAEVKSRSSKVFSSNQQNWVAMYVVPASTVMDVRVMVNDGIKFA
jgi:hypothetical protein